MGRYATQGSSGSFTPAPAGTHVARCFRIVDIGTQRGEYQGQPTERNQIVIFWELPNELVDSDDGKRPAIASKFYTNSLNEKATLRAHLESWRGRAFTVEELERFDLAKIIGVPCMLSIIPDGEKTKIAGVSAMPKGMTCPPAITEPSSFWIDEWSDEKFKELSEGMQKLIAKSDEYKARFPTAQRSMTAELKARNASPMQNPISDEPQFKEDDIPF